MILKLAWRFWSWVMAGYWIWHFDGQAVLLITWFWRLKYADWGSSFAMAGHWFFHFEDPWEAVLLMRGFWRPTYTHWWNSLATAWLESAAWISILFADLDAGVLNCLFWSWACCLGSFSTNSHYCFWTWMMGQWNWLFLAKLLWSWHDSRDIHIQGQWHCSRRQLWMELVACELVCLRTWILGQSSWYLPLWSHNLDLLWKTEFCCLWEQPCHSMVSQRQFCMGLVAGKLVSCLDLDFEVLDLLLWSCASRPGLILGETSSWILDLDAWAMDFSSWSPLTCCSGHDMFLKFHVHALTDQSCDGMVSRLRFCMGLVPVN